MIQVAAEVKKYVKSIDGSCYAIDRRTGPWELRRGVTRRRELNNIEPRLLSYVKPYENNFPHSRHTAAPGYTVILISV